MALPTKRIYNDKHFNTRLIRHYEVQQSGQIVEKELPILQKANQFKINSGEPYHK